MKKIINRHLLISFIFLAVFFQVFIAWSDESGLVHLVILHVNDTHGKLLPYDTDEAKNVYGIARMATLIKEMRAANKNNTLALHAGDDFSRGDGLTVRYYGEVNMLAMESAGYDAFVPGNGDFYFGVGNLVKQTLLVKFPTLAANILYKENGNRVFKPYVIKEIGGIKVAILGLGFVREEHPACWTIKLQDPVKEAKKILPELRQKADLVVALTHIGLVEDMRLAREVPQIDIIVGAHSHDQLNAPLRFPKENGEVIVAQAGEYGRFLGQLDVYLQSNKSGKYKVVKTEGKLIPVDSKIKEDEETARLLKRYLEPLFEVICISKSGLKNPESGESQLGNLVADALRIQTGADIALLDRGAVLGEIKPGKVIAATLSQIHPWHNRVLLVNLTGEQIKQLLTKQELHTSGFYYRKTNGNVVFSPDKPDNSSKTVIELSKPYKAALGEYVLASDTSLRNIPFIETSETVDSILLKYLKEICKASGEMP